MAGAARGQAGSRGCCCAQARQAWGRPESLTLRQVLTPLHWEGEGRGAAAGLALPVALSSPFPCTRLGLSLSTHTALGRPRCHHPDPDTASRNTAGVFGVLPTRRTLHCPHIYGGGKFRDF